MYNIAEEAAKHLLEDASLYDYNNYVSVKIKQQAPKEQPKESRYISQIQQAAFKRKNEHESAKSRINIKEATKYGSEVYITESYRQKQLELKKQQMKQDLEEKLFENKQQSGVLQSVYDKNQFQNRQPEMSNLEKIIDKIVEDKIQNIEHQEKIVSKSRSRSKSKEKQTIRQEKEEKINKYKERYQQRRLE
ncbi:hypothetical protein pb186bvf_020616 [Paramecium bursaria]